MGNTGVSFCFTHLLLLYLRTGNQITITECDYDGDRQQMIGTRNENEGNFYLWWSAFYVAYILPLLFVLSFSLVLFFWMVKWIRGCWITSSWANCIDRYVFKYDLLFILLFILFKVWVLQNKLTSPLVPSLIINYALLFIIPILVGLFSLLARVL